MGETSHHQCETLSEFKKNESQYENGTIHKLIKDIKNDMQDSGKSWAPQAIQQLQGGIDFIEKEYNAMPQLVAAYEQFYTDLKETGTKYCAAERQWAAIKEWVSNAKLPKAITDTIENLRNNNYRDENDDDF